MTSMVAIAAYVALFAAVAFGVLFVALLAGRFLRPNSPSSEKLRTYECGEPAVGSSYVQFDLRFYVVALLFIIFEVELAFFFPWATVFGKATRVLRGDIPSSSTASSSTASSSTAAPSTASTYRALAVPVPEDSAAATAENPAEQLQSLRHLALTAMADLVLFFGILLVGFAYVWRRGDLEWVRAGNLPKTTTIDI
jgi:NADH-quinone oxidoreductase subunit A